MTLGMARPHAQVAHSRENTAAGNSLVNHHAIHGTLEGPDTGAICRKWRIQRHRQRVKETAGGPVYASINGVVYGWGIIKGTNKTYVCSNWNSYFSGSRMCSGTAYVHRLSAVLNQWSLQLDF